MFRQRQTLHDEGAAQQTPWWNREDPPTCSPAPSMQLPGEEVGHDTQAVGYLCSAQSCNMFTVEAHAGAFARHRVLLGPYIMPCA
jgi:hypothetical protein